MRQVELFEQDYVDVINFERIWKINKIKRLTAHVVYKFLVKDNVRYFMLHLLNTNEETFPMQI